MCEEIMRPGTELNEAELESASGGGSGLYYNTLYVYCQHCSKLGRCGHSVMDLNNYILENGDILNYHNCPFYKKRMRGVKIMPEDMNRREAELNEAELENASGGVSFGPEVTHEKDRVAVIYCSPCERLGKCGHSTVELACYIVENGDIRGRTNCPFYKNA